MQAGVLIADRDRLAFRHDVTRAALYAGVPTSARHALHLQAGQALTAAGAPVERAAQHMLAGMSVDTRVLGWLAESSERLSARAPELAADLLSRAVERADARDELVGRLRVALAAALLRAGRFVRAEAVAREAPAAGPDPGSEPPLRWILVHACINQGDAEAALRESQTALSSANLTLAQTARFHGAAAQWLHILSRPVQATAEADSARRDGIASGDAQASAYGLQAAAGAKRWAGRFAEALDLAGQAVAFLTSRVELAALVARRPG